MRVIASSIVLSIVGLAAAYLVAQQSQSRGFDDSLVSPIHRAIGGKHEDSGLFRSYSSSPTLPDFWMFSDDTTDGSGTIYYIYTSAYTPPSSTNDDEDWNIEFETDSYTTLNEVTAHIISNYSHVNSLSDLVIHKHVVSLVN